MVDVTDTSAPQPDSIHEPVCRARGCGGEAAWGLLWNNPKIHTPVRRKVWLACAEHRTHLEDYLTTRGLLKGVVPVTDLRVADDDEPSAGNVFGALRDLS